ncbi:hypothetical protein JCM33374_g1077 [Metschnikowia sp. JCM 33374]|nr:hypothetical protein JCM33374_g1077 [Metschnikowia sp. JCM 33374]
MEPAPYGGFMTRTIDVEKQQKELLAKQEVEVIVNGTAETLRPNAIHVRGVDNLSTEEISAFVDLYLNHDSEAPNEADAPAYHRVDDSIWFRVQWIDDSNANIIFNTHSDALQALERLSEHWPQVENSASEESEPSGVFSQDYLDVLVEERKAKSYSASIPFYKYQKHLKEMAEGSDLFEAKKAEIEEQKESEMDEDSSSVVLYIRQALQSDRKVRNAAAYSRYYLLHGEPDRTKPRPSRRDLDDTRGRGTYARDEDDDEDLFASKIKTVSEKRKAEEVEEDLFAWRLRERSPGRS